MVSLDRNARSGQITLRLKHLNNLFDSTQQPTLSTLEVMMQEFIPVSKDSIHGEYISLNKLFSFSSSGFRIFGCIGARGYGKTFASKRKCVKTFKYQNLKMIILRDTTAACEEICKDGGIKLFKDVFNLSPALKNDKYDIVGETIFINGKQAGEVMPLSTYYKYKGNAYVDIGWVLFDEFIEESVQAYRGNRARQFANTIETIIRDNKTTRVMLTGNSIDQGNDILELFGIKLKNNQYGYYLNREKQIVIYYAPNSKEFEERKKNSLSTRITAGTFLDDEMNQNVFESGNCMIFEKRLPCNLYGIYYNLDGQCFRLYKANSKDIFYVCKDINSRSYSYMRYVFHVKQVAADRILANQDIRLWFKDLLQKQRVQFESQYLFNVFCSIINNTLKK